MDDFFTDIQQTTHTSNPSIPIEAQYQHEQFNPNPSLSQPTQNSQFSPLGYQPKGNFHTDAPENQFNEFEEDEASKRIREEEERIQNVLRERSQREWSQKTKRREQGRRQLNQFLTAKQDQKTERAARNIRNEVQNKEELQKLNIEAGWKKVITNINVRQGQRKGPKDTNRMREAILRRRQDDSR